jgi:hypothetical protein
MIYPNALYLSTFQEHWAETLLARKAAGAPSSTVAEALRKYQDAKKWPKSGIPLPDEMLVAVQKRDFGITHSRGAIYLLACLGALALIAALYLVLSVDEEWDVGVVPFVLAGVGILVLVLACAGCVATRSRGPGLQKHVEALHLLYVYEKLPMKENPGKEEAFRATIGHGRTERTFRVLENGDLFF